MKARRGEAGKRSTIFAGAGGGLGRRRWRVIAAGAAVLVPFGAALAGPAAAVTLSPQDGVPAAPAPARSSVAAAHAELISALDDSGALPVRAHRAGRTGPAATTSGVRPPAAAPVVHQWLRTPTGMHAVPAPLQASAAALARSNGLRPVEVLVPRTAVGSDAAAASAQAGAGGDAPAVVAADSITPLTPVPAAAGASGAAAAGIDTTPALTGAGHTGFGSRAWGLGPRRVLAFAVVWSTDPEGAATPAGATLRSTLKSNVSTAAADTMSYWSQQTGGRVTASATSVVDTVVLPGSKPATCSLDDAYAQALAIRHVDPDAWDSIMVRWAPVPCGWAGLAIVGNGFLWLNGTLDLDVSGHEMGHNVGLNHSGSLFCPGTTAPGEQRSAANRSPLSHVCASGSYDYGNDIMGGGFVPIDPATGVGVVMPLGPIHAAQLGLAQPSPLTSQVSVLRPWTVTGGGSTTANSVLLPAPAWAGGELVAHYWPTGPGHTAGVEVQLNVADTGFGSVRLSMSLDLGLAESMRPNSWWEIPDTGTVLHVGQIDGSGAQVWLVEASSDTAAPTAPVLTTRTIDRTHSHAVLTWSTSTDTGGSGLAGYEVWVNGHRSAFVAATPQALQQSTDLGQAYPGAMSVQVIAVDAAGNRTPSPAADVRVWSDNYDGSPRASISSANMTRSVVGGNFVTADLPVRWVFPDGVQTSTVRVVVTDLSGGSPVSRTVPAAVTWGELLSGTAGHMYTIDVLPADPAHNDESIYAGASITLIGRGTATVTTSSRAGRTYVTPDWNLPQVVVSDGRGHQWTPTPGDSTALPLDVGTSVVTARTVFADGTLGALTPLTTVTVPDPSPPTPPVITSPVAGTEVGRQVRVTWQASADPESGIRNYRLSTDSSANVLVLPASARSAVVTVGTPGMIAWDGIVVEAVNGSGDSAYSRVEVLVHSYAARPRLEVHRVKRSASTATFRVTWSLSAGAGSRLTVLVNRRQVAARVCPDGHTYSVVTTVKVTRSAKVRLAAVHRDRYGNQATVSRVVTRSTRS